jgi:hypothetical protein
MALLQQRGKVLIAFFYSLRLTNIRQFVEQLGKGHEIIVTTLALNTLPTGSSGDLPVEQV